MLLGLADCCQEPDQVRPAGCMPRGQRSQLRLEKLNPQTIAGQRSQINYNMPTRKITRVARRAGNSAPQRTAKASEHASLVDLLNVIHMNSIGILPVSPHKSLGITGKGLSGAIQQSTADVATVLAFKEGIPSKIIHDTDDDQDWYSLVTEITILQHRPIQANIHIIDLLGISFYVSAGRRAWPVAVTSKVNRGDLTAILSHDHDGLLTEDVRLMLLASLVEAVYTLHSCGKF
jgi:hypothetical protein